MKHETTAKSEIHKLLFMTAKKAHQGVERWFLSAKIGITPLQFGVLRAIGSDTLTLNELARRMMFKPPSILPSIDTLERGSYVSRRNDPDDRRKIHLVVTPKGKKVIERVTSSRKLDPLGAAFRKMPEQKRKRLTSLLAELNELIKSP